MAVKVDDRHYKILTRNVSKFTQVDTFMAGHQLPLVAVDSFIQFQSCYETNCQALLNPTDPF